MVLDKTAPFLILQIIGQDVNGKHTLTVLVMFDKHQHFNRGTTCLNIKL